MKFQRVDNRATDTLLEGRLRKTGRPGGRDEVDNRADKLLWRTSGKQRRLPSRAPRQRVAQ